MDGRARLALVPNPLDPYESRKLIHVLPGTSISAVMAEHWKDLRGLSVDVVHNGLVVENPKESEIVLGENDSLVICGRLRGSGSEGRKNIVRSVAMIAVMASAFYVPGALGFALTTFKGAAIAATISIGGALLINSLLPVQVPRLGGEDPGANNTYGWLPSENQIVEGLSIPVLYGVMRVAPMIISKYTTTDGESQLLNVLYAVCEGEVTSIASLEINDNDIANYTGVTTDTKLGTNTQTVISGFQRTGSEKSISTEMTGNTYTTNITQGNAVNSLGFGFVFPNGLCKVSGNGFDSHTIAITMEYKLTSEPTTWTTVTETITGNKMGAIRKYFEYVMAVAGEYNVRVKVQTARQTGTEFIETVYFEYLQEFVNDSFTYPNTALLGLKALATDQLNGSSPRVTALVTRTNVSVWTGAAYENKPSNNPAWACYDLIHNSRYGAGVSYDRITYADFSSWADFCTAAGYECNIYLESATTLSQAIAKVAMVGRGTVVQRGTKFGAIWDGTSTAVQLFTIGNIVADSFEETYLEKANRADVIEISYLDASNEYDRRTIEIQASGYDTSTAEAKINQIALEGCTSWTIAAKYGKFLMNCQQYLMRSIVFRTDVDAISCQPGDVISVQHDVPQWGYGGRVVSATANTVTLDQSLTVENGETYVIVIRHSATDTLETKTLANPGAGSYSAFTLASGNWGTTPSADDLYAWGKQNIETKDFRVTSIKRNDDFTCQISALEYRAEVYLDDVTIPEYPVESDLPQVAGVRADDIYKIGPDGEKRLPYIDVTWRGFAVLWNIFIKESVENVWRKVGESNRTQYQISGVDIGKTYTVAVSTTDNPEDGDSDTVTMTIDPPEAVTNLSAEVIDNFVLLRWKPPASELPISHYVITKGNVFAMSQSIGRADKSFTTIFELLSGTYRYWVYAVNTAGDVGTETYVDVTLTLSTDYKLQTDISSVFDGTLSNVVYCPEPAIVGPLDTSETWEEHFVNHNQTTLGGFADSGYTYYFEPNYQTTGYYQEDVIDLGATVNKGSVVLTTAHHVLTGDETKIQIRPTISTSPDNVTWTDYVGVWQTTVEGFRYVKYKLDITSDGPSVVAITSAKISIVLKKIRETGTNEVTDANAGKTVTFTESFVDVDSIVCTARSSAGAFKHAVYDFSDVPNPTGFTVYILDDAGAKTTGTFSFAVEGV